MVVSHGEREEGNRVLEGEKVLRKFPSVQWLGLHSLTARAAQLCQKKSEEVLDVDCMTM